MSVYTIKLVNGDRTEVYSTAQYCVTTTAEDSPAARLNLKPPGIEVELIPEGKVIHLPRDGSAIYVESTATGHTTNVLRWPIVAGVKKEFRA